MGDYATAELKNYKRGLAHATTPSRHTQESNCASSSQLAATLENSTNVAELKDYLNKREQTLEDNPKEDLSLKDTAKLSDYPHFESEGEE